MDNLGGNIQGFHCSSILYVSFFPAFFPAFFPTFFPAFLHTFFPTFLHTFLPAFLSAFLCRRTQHIVLNHHGIDMFVIRQLFRPVHIVINQFAACFFQSGSFRVGANFLFGSDLKKIARMHAYSKQIKQKTDL